MNEVKKFDFSWIDSRLKKERKKYPDSKRSDREIVDSFTYPYEIVHWLDLFGTSVILDAGGVDMLYDVDEYQKQLEEYKKKF